MRSFIPFMLLVTVAMLSFNLGRDSANDQWQPMLDDCEQLALDVIEDRTGERPLSYREKRSTTGLIYQGCSHHPEGCAPEDMPTMNDPSDRTIWGALSDTDE